MCFYTEGRRLHEGSCKLQSVSFAKKCIKADYCYILFYCPYITSYASNCSLIPTAFFLFALTSILGLNLFIVTVFYFKSDHF